MEKDEIIEKVNGDEIKIKIVSDKNKIIKEQYSIIKYKMVSKKKKIQNDHKVGDIIL